jgi:hypothetical protein
MWHSLTIMRVFRLRAGGELFRITPEFMVAAVGIFAAASFAIFFSAKGAGVDPGWLTTTRSNSLEFKSSQI